MMSLPFEAGATNVRRMDIYLANIPRLSSASSLLAVHRYLNIRHPADTFQFYLLIP